MQPVLRAKKMWETIDLNHFIWMWIQNLGNNPVFIRNPHAFPSMILALFPRSQKLEMNECIVITARNNGRNNQTVIKCIQKVCCK